jgi:CDGSH-type Zn-finger protein
MHTGRCGELTPVLLSLGPLEIRRTARVKSTLEIDTSRGQPISNLEMSIYICKCGEKKDLVKVSMVVIDSKVRVKEALCKCGNYMEEEDQSFTGFPSLIRTEPTLNKKTS